MRKMAVLLLVSALCLGLCGASAAPAAPGVAAAQGGQRLSAGLGFVGAVDGAGTLWTWGHGIYGQVGTGAVDISNPPARAMEDVSSVACGAYHAAAVRTDGTLWTWGNDRCGQLGTAGAAGRVSPVDGYPFQPVPVQMMEDVAAVACGDWHTAAVKADGTLWTWGSDRDGQLGGGGTGRYDGMGEPFRDVPVQVMEDVAAVACGSDMTAAVRTDGSLWVWGSILGAVPDGAAASPGTPVKVLEDVAAVACGATHMAAVRTDGSLWAWGYNDFGQVCAGAGDAYYIAAPVQVMEDVAAVACGNDFTAAVKTDGTLWTWGGNYRGQLGSGLDPAPARPSLNAPSQVMEGVTAVDCGEGFAVAARADGSLWAWGIDRYGALGHPSGEGELRNAGGEPIQRPRQVSGLTMDAGTARAGVLTVLVDGRAVSLSTCSLTDGNGNDTNYLRLREVAAALSDTPARFDVAWDQDAQAIAITTGAAYSGTAALLSAPFSGEQIYRASTAAVKVDGSAARLEAIALTDINGSGYTYFKLRDLGQALGFGVDWDQSAQAAVITTSS